MTPSTRETKLMEALVAAGLTGPWNGMPPSHRKRWVEHVLEAKKEETALRRIGKVVEAMRERID